MPTMSNDYCLLECWGNLVTWFYTGSHGSSELTGEMAMQEDFWVRGQPGLESEFQDSQGYTEKPGLKTNKQERKEKKERKDKTRHL